MLMRGENRRSVEIMKLILLFSLILIINLMSYADAIKINEIKSKGTEWAEIYNPEKEELNLSGWTIQDNSTDHPDTLSCENISDCELTTNAEYFLILGKAVKIEDITSENIIYFYTDDQKIGNGLNDNGDIVTIKENNATIDSISYGTISNSSFSLQLVNEKWCENSPTAGENNKCKEEIIQNDSEENNSPTQEIITNDSDNSTENSIVMYNNGTNKSNGPAETASPAKNKSSAKTSPSITSSAVIDINSAADNASETPAAKQVIYQSKNEEMKKASVYLLGGLLVLLVIWLIKNQGRKTSEL